MLLTVLLSPVIAAWQYYIEFTVADNTSTARSGLPILTGINAQNLIDAGYLNASGNNSQMQEGGFDSISGMATGNVSLFIPSLLANQERTYRLYTGYSPQQTTFPIIVGNNGYITIADNATLEGADNFTFEMEGWVDTTAVGEYLIYKQNAFSTNISAVGVVTSSISMLDSIGSAATNRGGNTTFGNTLIDKANPSSYNGTVCSVEIWADTNLIAAEVGTFSLVTGTTYECRDSESVGNVIAGSAQTFSELDIDVKTGDFIGLYYTAGDIELDSVGGSGVVYTAGDHISAGDNASYASFGAGYAMSVYGVVDYPLSVNATGVSEAEHIVKTTADGTNLKIYIDGVEKDSATLGTASIPNNTNDWLLMQNSVVPYMNFYKHTVAGTLQGWYEPTAIISGTVLPDRQGTDQSGVITWGTNPSGIEITIGGITGYESTTPSTTISGASVVGSYKKPTDWFQSAGAFEGVLTPELKESFANAASDIGMEERSLWLMTMFGVATAVGLSVLLFTGSVLGTMFVVLAVLVMGSSAGIIDMALVFIVGILSVTTFYLTKQH